MKKYTGIIKGSRTLDVTAITAAIGAALIALPQLQDLVTPEMYGGLMMILSIVNAYLRSITTKALGDEQ